jgi:hypothetical protein
MTFNPIEPDDLYIKIAYFIKLDKKGKVHVIQKDEYKNKRGFALLNIRSSFPLFQETPTRQKKKS